MSSRSSFAFFGTHKTRSVNVSQKPFYSKILLYYSRATYSQSYDSFLYYSKVTYFQSLNLLIYHSDASYSGVGIFLIITPVRLIPKVRIFLLYYSRATYFRSLDLIHYTGVIYSRSLNFLFYYYEAAYSQSMNF